MGHFGPTNSLSSSLPSNSFLNEIYYSSLTGAALLPMEKELWELDLLVELFVAILGELMLN
jgi:hypothetical protein